MIYNIFGSISKDDFHWDTSLASVPTADAELEEFLPWYLRSKLTCIVPKIPVGEAQNTGAKIGHAAQSETRLPNTSMYVMHVMLLPVLPYLDCGSALLLDLHFCVTVTIVVISRRPFENGLSANKSYLPEDISQPYSHQCTS